MNYYLANVSVSRDKDIKYRLKKEDLVLWINLINKELGTEKISEPRLTISLRLVSIKEMKKLNFTFLGVDKTTNVLSFAPDLNGKDEEDNLMGDIAICIDVLKKEAKLQNKKIDNHFAHLFIHGALHLLGYFHDSKKDARLMEKLEKKVLNKIGIADPYQIELR